MIFFKLLDWQLSPVVLKAKEVLFVTDFNRPGEFFGQFSSAAEDGLDEMFGYLKKCYSSDS